MDEGQQIPRREFILNVTSLRHMSCVSSFWLAVVFGQYEELQAPRNQYKSKWLFLWPLHVFPEVL